MDTEFNIVENIYNLESEQKLHDLLRDGSGVLFVGSGISRHLGYPSWDQVLHDLGDLVESPKTKEVIIREIKRGELLLAAEIIKHSLSEDIYRNKIKEIFCAKDPSYSIFHKNLARLKVKGFVTTNYDPVIESALRSIQDSSIDCTIVTAPSTKKYVHNFISSLIRPHFSSRFHLYLHGKFDYPETTILSYGDYANFYLGLDICSIGKKYTQLVAGEIDIPSFEAATKLKDYKNVFCSLHYKTAYLLMVSQQLIFTGFGLRDPYLIKIIDDIQDDFDLAYKAHHYVLLSENEGKNWTEDQYRMTRDKWRRKGIEVVFFRDKSDYSGIETYVGSLASELFIPDIGHPQGVSVEGGENVQQKLSSPPEVAAKNTEAQSSPNVNSRLKEIMSKRKYELKGK